MATYFMKNRSVTFDRFKQYKAFVKLQIGNNLKKLQVDNVKEYTEGDFRKYLDSEGIILQAIMSYSPAQNGVVECLNQTLVKHALAMLLAKNLPKFLWEDAMAYANYLYNQSPIQLLHNATLFQKFSVDYWILVPDSKRSKLDAKLEKYIFVRLNTSGAGWNYYHIPTHQILMSWNVIFQRHMEPLLDLSKIPASDSIETSVLLSRPPTPPTPPTQDQSIHALPTTPLHLEKESPATSASKTPSASVQTPKSLLLSTPSFS